MPAPYVPNAKSAPFDWKKHVYKQWRRSAKQRGIEIALDYEQWSEVWGEHWPNRERCDLVLARFGDTGPYAPGNVYITTRGQNVRDARTYRAQATNRVSTAYPQGQEPERPEFSHFFDRFCSQDI